MFGAKTGQKIVLIQYKKDFVPLILSDLVHRASHITLPAGAGLIFLILQNSLRLSCLSFP